jgi:S1-C subfamily serine protease
MKKIIKFFLGLFFILFLAIIGSAIFSILILPKIIENPKFVNSPFIKAFKKELRVYPKEEVYIEENTALVSAVEKCEKSMIDLISETPKEKRVFSGLILSSDGLAVVLNEDLKENSKVFYQGEDVPFEVLKRDQKENLALIKLNKKDLPTLSFIDKEEIVLGKRIFVLSSVFNCQGAVEKIVEEGIISFFEPCPPFRIKTSIPFNSSFSGGVAFDVSSNIVGLTVSKENKNLEIIPISLIKTFSGL